MVEGAKWCGKTQSSLQAANSVVYMQDPDEGLGYLAMADTKPSLVLEGDPPLLLDEWQMAPVLWDAVRFAVDKRGLMRQFILTGSATPSDNLTAHSGTGRIARMLMRPMSCGHAVMKSWKSTSDFRLRSSVSSCRDATRDLLLDLAV